MLSMLRSTPRNAQEPDAPIMHGYRVHMHTTVVAAIAERCRPHIGRMSQDYARRVRLLPGYSTAAVTDAELQETARETLDLMMRSLTGEQVSAQLARQSESIGVRRARQGLALDSLTRAVRMDFRFIWEVLREEATAEEKVLLGDDVATVWEVVELHTSRIQAAYIAQLTDLHRELEIERGSLLRRLLIDGVVDEVQLGHISTTFGWGRTSEFHVVVAGDKYMHAFRDSLRRVAPGVDIDLVDGKECVIVERSIVLADERAWGSLPAGISPPAFGLDRLPAAWELAQRLATFVDSEDSAMTFDSQWPALMQHGAGAGLDLVRAHRLRSLRTMPDASRQTLIDTFSMFFERGSVAEVASQQFLHRNSVLKRLQKIADVTGLDPRVPSEASLLRVLLAE